MTDRNIPTDPSFKIGEIAFVIPFEIGPIDKPEYVCTEVTVIGLLRKNGRSKTGWAYDVRTHDGRKMCASPRVLRKKLPPSDLVDTEVYEEMLT